MLSDESSSDSETGRFKCRTKKEDEKPSQRQDSSRQVGRGRQSDRDRFHRDFDRKRVERDHPERFSRDRDRHRLSRHSPSNRRSSINRRSSVGRRSSANRRSPSVRKRHSTDRSPGRRSHERHKYDKDSREKSKTRDHRSSSRDVRKESRAHISHDSKRNLKEEIIRNIEKPKSPERVKISREKSLSPANKVKRSEIYKPPPLQPLKRKSDSPILVEEHDDSDKSEVVQLGSYYKMIPAVVKEKSEESSEIDSSDDERLRAKLLNLEKELSRTNKKKKHKKKHKRRSSKTSKDRDRDIVAVEVSSTTDDILDKSKLENSNNLCEIVEEVTSTQKSTQKESCEEGEISSDDDSQNQFKIDPTDLRHKLRRTVHKSEHNATEDVCGPALPPHLAKRHKRSTSPEIEGPILPPHLQRKPQHIGPSIPDDMRKVLAETKREVIVYESSDEDVGIGPLPTGSEEKWSDAHRRLEERALDIKIKRLDGHSGDTKIKSRESWMLELPEGKAKYLGLEARSFRAKEGPDMTDRSSWTDTPEEKSRKAAGQVKEEDLETVLRREARERQIANRDNEQELAAKKHKKKHKREESLLDMHQKKIKKKKKKEEKEDGKKERRPFSRDVDLQVNRFDEAQKKSIIKKAQGLNSRFSQGEAKYL